MKTVYTNFLFKEMDPMFEFVPSPEKRQLLMTAMLARFLHSDSLLDLSQTYGVNKDSLYSSLDAVSPPRWLRRLVKRGRHRLLGQLRKWHAGDPSFKSRHFITLCADDFTRTARGSLGEWTGIFYSGAEKRPVIGLNIEALCAVIGDGQEVILLDVRLVPPKPKGSGRLPLNHNEWLRRSLRNLDAWLQKKGTHLHGLALSVDAAYVCPETVDLVKKLEVHMVSRLSANRKVSGEVDDGPFEALVSDFAGLALFVGGRRIKPLREEEGVEYQRNTAYVKSLGTTVLMITFIRGREFRVYFTTNTNMKAITLRSILRYRWQVERLFWVLKQDIGIGDIHNHKGDRVEVRVYLQCMLVQTIRDASGFFNCSPKDIVRAIRRSPDLLLWKLGFPSAFASPISSSPVPEVPLAA